MMLQVCEFKLLDAAGRGGDVPGIAEERRYLASVCECAVRIGVERAGFASRLGVPEQSVHLRCQGPEARQHRDRRDAPP